MALTRRTPTKRLAYPYAGAAYSARRLPSLASLCSSPERKYERASYRNIAEVLWAETSEKDISEFIRRLIFNALVGNADMHLKNWSLIYPDGRKLALSPGYDFVSIA